MPKYEVKIGIIGGSGFKNALEELDGYPITQIPFVGDKSFGTPSSDFYKTNISGIETVIIFRHGMKHDTNPTMVNYRANIEALRAYGCTHVLATTAGGSLKESLDRGQLMVLDNFIDRTTLRKNTFYDNTSKTNYQGVCHIPIEPPFDVLTSDIIVQAGKELGIDVKKGGTTVTIEGPRFSSKAESNLHRSWNSDLVNMTTCPEVYLAKEAGLLYASIAMVTDFDCWKSNDELVNAADVVKVFKKNIQRITKVLIKTVEIIGTKDWDESIDNLKSLIQNSQMSTIN